MIDRRLRPLKDRLLAPLVAALGGRVSPGWLTAVSLVAGVGAGLLAAAGSTWWALAAFVLGRLLDGLDGAVARSGGRSSDLGGYLDIVADTVGYAAVPLGIAVSQSDEQVWAWCAVLLATFYVNAIGWAYLSAIVEKRRRADDTGEVTAVHMPSGLVEGAETIVLYVAMLLWPQHAVWWFAAMAALVAVTIAQRLWWAHRRFR